MFISKNARESGWQLPTRRWRRVPSGYGDERFVRARPVRAGYEEIVQTECEVFVMALRSVPHAERRDVHRTGTWRDERRTTSMREDSNQKKSRDMRHAEETQRTPGRPRPPPAARPPTPAAQPCHAVARDREEVDTTREKSGGDGDR